MPETMRTANSLVSPSPSSVMTPRNGTSTSAVLPLKMNLSDSKPRRLSESAAVMDKENQSIPGGIDLWPFSAEEWNISSNHSVQPMELPTEDVNFHVPVSLINHDDHDHKSQSPLTESLSPPSLSSPQGPTPTAASTTSSQSTAGIGQTFWLNFLEDHTEPSNDGEAPTCFTPLGQLIQRTSTSGSPLSEATAYDTQEVDETNDGNVLVDPLPSENSVSTSSIHSLEEPVGSPLNESKAEIAINVLSPVQAARLLFEQRAKEATTVKTWNRKGSHTAPKGKAAPSLQTPAKNHNLDTEQIKSVGETMTSPYVSVFDAPPTINSIPGTPAAIIEVTCSIPATNALSSDNKSNDDSVDDEHSKPKDTNLDTPSKNNNKNDNTIDATSTPEEQLTPFQRARRNFSRHQPDSAQKPPPTFRAASPLVAKQTKHHDPVVNKSAAKTKPPLSPSPQKNKESDNEFHHVLKAWRDKLDVRVNSQNHSGDVSQRFTRASTIRKVANSPKATSDQDLSSLNEVVHGSYSHDGSTHYFESDSLEESFDESEESSRALVILEHNNAVQIMIGESNARDTSHDELKIRNVELVPFIEQNQIIEDKPCECSGSVFSGNDDLVSFFLPQMGMACTCGRISTGFVNPHEPTSLENVLRPWQVEFLNSFGIYSGEQLVKARHRSGAILARALRQWRKKHNMLYFKTSSCSMAIDIWAKTCKVFVRSIRRQISAGQDVLESKPNQVMTELVSFVSDLPAAPKKMNEHFTLENIELESQVEV